MFSKKIKNSRWIFLFLFWAISSASKATAAPIPEPTVVYEYQANAGISALNPTSSPAVLPDGKTVVFVDDIGTVYWLKDGKLVYQVELGPHDFRYAPTPTVLHEGTVVVNDVLAATLYWLKDGKKVYSYSVQVIGVDPLVLSDGTVLVVPKNKSEVLWLKDGKLLLKAELTDFTAYDSIIGLRACNNGKVAVFAGLKAVWLDETGKQIYPLLKFKNGIEYKGNVEAVSPQLSDGSFFVQLSSATSSGFEWVKDGMILDPGYSVPASGSVRGSPILLADGSLVFTVSESWNDNFTYWFRYGKISYSHPRSFAVAGHLTDDTVISGVNGRTAWIKNGTLLKLFNAKDGLLSGPTVLADDSVVVVNSKGKVYWLR